MTRPVLFLAFLLLLPLSHGHNLLFEVPEVPGSQALSIDKFSEPEISSLNIMAWMSAGHSGSVPRWVDWLPASYFGYRAGNPTQQQTRPTKLSAMPVPKAGSAETLLCLKPDANTLYTVPDNCRPLPAEGCGLVVSHDDEGVGGELPSLLFPYPCDDLLQEPKDPFNLSPPEPGSNLHPLLDENKSLLVWEGHSQKITFDFFQSRIPENFSWLDRYIHQLLWIYQTTDQQGQIIYYWYDPQGNRHVISQQEYWSILARLFESWLHRLYPEVFGPRLPAGGGWHVRVYTQRKPPQGRQASGREQNASDSGPRSGASGRGTGVSGRGTGVRGRGTGVRGRGTRGTRGTGASGGGTDASVKAADTDDTDDTIDGLVKEFQENPRLQQRIGHWEKKYKGIDHSKFCNRIKRVTSNRKRPLSQNEKERLEGFVVALNKAVKSSSFNARSTCTCIHSLTSSQLLYPTSGDPELTKPINTLTQALLKRVTEINNFDEQGIANLLWALAKLVDNGLDHGQVNDAVKTLLPQVVQVVQVAQEVSHQAGFNPQEFANLLWALAKLVDNGLDHGLVNNAVTALLPQVKIHRAGFKPQEVANLLWALAKLMKNELDHGLVNNAVTALLPQVKIHQAGFNPQEFANLLWALAKLVDNGLDHGLVNNAVTALLPQVEIHRAGFKPQGVANLLWALAKLVDNGLDHGQVNEAVTALLPLVVQVAQGVQGGSHQAGFKPQEVANLLWAVAFLGESIELKKISEILNALSFSEQYSVVQQGQLLWSFIVFMARDVSISDQLRSSMKVWYEALKQQSADDNELKTILAMAAVWLRRQEANIIPSYKTNTSELQKNFRTTLTIRYPNREIREEFSLRHLPPVDVYLPDLKLAIEVQGPHHFTNNMNKESLSKTGRTILKVETYKQLKIRIIEVSYRDIDYERLGSLWGKMSQIETDMASQSLASNHDDTDDEYETAKEDLTADEYETADESDGVSEAD